MIDFRYHVVSLVAVLLALATGILVGSSLLNQSLLDSQRATISSLAKEKDELRSELTVTEGQVGYRDDYLASLNTTLLPSRLIGQRVVLVVLPRASEKDVVALAKTLGEAGAQVPTTIAVTDDFFADDAGDDDETTNKAAERDALVKRYAQPDVKAKDAYDQLAGAVMAKVPGRTLEAPANNLLGQLDKAGFIERRSGSDRGDVAVVVAGPPSEEPTPVELKTRSGAVALAGALDRAGMGTVVAGPLSSTVGGVIGDAAQVAVVQRGLVGRHRRLAVRPGRDRVRAGRADRRRFGSVRCRRRGRLTPARVPRGTRQDQGQMSEQGRECAASAG